MHSSVPDIAQVTPRSGQRYKNALALMRIAEKMTRYGFKVDRDAIARHIAQADARAQKFTARFLELTGLPTEALGQSGAGHTDAVRKHFWDTLRAPAVEFDKKTRRPQFNNAALATYATSFKHKPFGPPAAALIAVRKNRKLMEFCHAYEHFSRADGRIHFQFNVLGTVTGRWTSSTRMRVMSADDSHRNTISCNAQQIPVKTPTFDFGSGPERLVESLRNVFIPDDGCVLLKADYDQLELRLIAYVYGVKELLRIIDLGDKADAHCFTAAHLFKSMNLDPYGLKPKDKASPAYQAREAAKGCAYGISYQMHSNSGRYPQLTKNLKGVFPAITERQVAAMAEGFFSLYPELKEGQLRQKTAVDDAGFAELTIDGRRLYYPATMRGYNQALNFPMQGTGGALCNRALLELEPQLDWEGGCQVRVQVHDELLVQAPYSRAAEVAKALETAMSRPAQIGASYAGIPAAADPGLNWGECKKWSEFCAAHPGILP